jgi:hypothetical protein
MGIRRVFDSQFGKLRYSKFDLVIVAISDVDENAGLLRRCYEIRTEKRLCCDFYRF